MNTINAKKYQEMLIFGAQMMEAHKEEINRLNVFPVPDGDTGSNMNMTFQSGVKNIINSPANSVSEIAKDFSKGLLMGARGNSGVILSQFFRGISEGLEGKAEITTVEYKAALNTGVQRAYASVIKAVEGTILTVCKEMSANVSEKEDFVEFFESLITEAEISLNNTPNLLPVLKEVGVVDSGGKGLLVIFKGMQAAVNGEELDLSNIQSFEDFLENDEHSMNPDEIEFRYCTEMLIQLSDKDLDTKEVIAFLETKGDSIVAIMDEDILKVHVHTEEPVEVLAYGKKLGDFIHVKSENMKIQAMESLKAQSKEKKEQAIVAVASSKEIGELFKEINDDVFLVEGGQTMNPSTEDIIKAIKSANAKKVIILPNNSNIVMSAKAAKDFVQDVQIEVVETKFITQAIEVLINYSKDMEFENNIFNMKEALNATTNIEITNAIKDTTLDGIEIHEGDFLGVVDGKLKHSIKEEKEILKSAAEVLIEKDVEIINILLGENSNENLVNELIEYIEAKEPFIEIQTYKTNQPVYSYLISGV